MLSGLLIVFVPLFVGYLILINQKEWLNRINRFSTSCLYLILFLMGASLGQLNDLGTVLPTIGYTAFLMAIIIQLCNIICLLLFDLLIPFRLETQNNEVMLSRSKLLLESTLLCSTVFIGGLVGFLTKDTVLLSSHLSVYPLVIMIFCVGVQLRNSGIPLRDVFLNKRGIQLSIVMLVSTMISGMIISVFCNFSLVQGLTFASGLGWYSLSSVLIGDAWGTVAGSTAFFNDLSRELICLLTIPFFMQRFPSTAVGLGGATSLDVSLPIIQKTGGMQVVPIAISFGFIINILVPILLPLFIGLA
ncbi:lysine exporter LysO family protein [Phocoenobacter atlanticus]|uniref:lysine exporter LysO family protein n=1 Tax=Phocoenobacter atlanticus TaxID=3416742 RepID=UPI002748E927|nr:lysine exporter LysO family protein [Pasteurella atlantica]MDP8100589.1 lysine exporter LysO family protein [Pasteurella atlantica]